MLLFVCDEMFGRGHDSSALNALDTLFKHDACQIWIRGKSFPVAALLRDTAKWTSDGNKLHVNSLSTVLRTHGLTASKYQASISSGRHADAGREDGVEISAGYTGW